MKQILNFQMNRQSVLIIAFLFMMSFISTVSNAQSPWHWQNPSPTGSDLSGIHFFDANHGLLIGMGGTILSTSDAGSTWNNVQCGTSMDLEDVCFLNSSVGIAVGGDDYLGSIILRTSNSGSAWSIQDRGTQRKLNAVAFNSNTSCVAVGEYGKILRSSNAGVNWVSVVSGIGTSLYGISFSDTMKGIAVGTGGALITTDGGLSWIQKTDSILAINNFYFDIVNTNRNNWFVVGGHTDFNYNHIGEILHSTDGGSSWKLVKQSLNGYCRSIRFIDSLNGFAVGENGTAFATTNGGSTWIEHDPLPFWGTHLYSSYFFNQSHGFVVGDNGTLLSTIDSGSTWTEHKQTITLEAFSQITFIDESNAVAVGPGGVFRTTNDGTTWTHFQLAGISGVYFPLPLTGFVVGSSGIYGEIYKTTDGGESWNDITPGVIGQLSRVYFIDASTGMAIGSGTILRTTDGGSTWQTQTNAFWGGLNDIKFINNHKGFIVGSDNTLLQTTNGGITWTGRCCTLRGCEESGIYSDFYGISFADSNNGIIVGSTVLHGGVIFSTTDGGNSWVCRTTSYSLYSVCFSDSNTVVAVGGLGSILYSTDVGKTWSSQNSGTTFYLRDVAFTNHDLGTIVGASGIILHTVNGGTTSIHEDRNLSNILPTAFRLGQNYPNPFNPATTIQYQLPTRAFVHLSVYNILGQEVQVIVNETQEPGNKSIRFNAGNLSSGMYFYRIMAGSFSDIKKMVVIK
jgi:photosystem II stability/assembly factor-like uncharacterized protein